MFPSLLALLPGVAFWFDKSAQLFQCLRQREVAAADSCCQRLVLTTLITQRADDNVTKSERASTTD